MKKFACIILTLALSMSVFSVETWLSLEYQYGFSFQTEKNPLSSPISNVKSNSWQISYRIALKGHVFWDNIPVGLYFNFGFPLPIANGKKERGSLKFNSRAVTLPLSFGFGVSFKHFLSEKGTVHYSFGSGLSYNASFARISYQPTNSSPEMKTEKDYMHTLIFDVFADIGYKHFFIENIFIDAGLFLDFEVAKHDKNTSITRTPSFSGSGKKTEKWAESFFGVKALAYVGFGATF